MRVLVLAIFTALASPAAASFQAAPDQYGAIIDPALRRAQSELRLSRAECNRATPIVCQFSARKVSIEVEGAGSGTGSITLVASFRDIPDDQAATLLENILSVLGATMVAYDPMNPADRRSDLLSALGEAALEAGEAHKDSDDVHYALAVDDATGRLAIVVQPIAAAHS